ncbi:MAG: GGDEF-domain containing protein, partial [Pseudomonadota bacterium]
MKSLNPGRLATISSDPFALARGLRTPVWVYDTDCCRIAYANEAACKIWSAEDEASLKSRDLSQGMSTTVAKRLKQYQSDFIERNAEFCEFWTLYPNGTPITVNVVYTGFIMPDGRMAMMCEVTGEAKETPETLRSTEALLHTDVLIALYTIEGR